MNLCVCENKVYSEHTFFYFLFSRSQLLAALMQLITSGTVVSKREGGKVCGYFDRQKRMHESISGRIKCACVCVYYYAHTNCSALWLRPLFIDFLLAVR